MDSVAGGSGRLDVLEHIASVIKDCGTSVRERAISSPTN